MIECEVQSFSLHWRGQYLEGGTCINEGELKTQTFESNLILRSIVLSASAAVSRVLSRREGP